MSRNMAESGLRSTTSTKSEVRGRVGSVGAHAYRSRERGAHQEKSIEQFGGATFWRSTCDRAFLRFLSLGGIPPVSMPLPPLSFATFKISILLSICFGQCCFCRDIRPLGSKLIHYRLEIGRPSEQSAPRSWRHERWQMRLWHLLGALLKRQYSFSQRPPQS